MKIIDKIKDLLQRFKPDLPKLGRWQTIMLDIAVGTATVIGVIYFTVSATLPDERINVTVEADGAVLNCHIFPSTNPNSLINELGINIREKDEVLAPSQQENITENTVEVMDDVICEGDAVIVNRAFPVVVKSHNEITLLHVTDGTVGDALRTAGVEYDVNDKLSEQVFSDLIPGQQIIHTDITTKYDTAYKTLNYKEISVYDDDRYNDTDPIKLQAGADGTKQVTQRIIIEDGVEVSRKVVDQVVITPATDEIIEYGNKIHYQTNYYGDKRIYRKKPTAGKDGWVEMTMDFITAYSGDKESSTGVTPKFGVIAVNPYYIPYYTEIWVDGYGYGKALDTGAFRKYTNEDGSPVNQLDLFFVRKSDARRWGRKRNVTVLVRMGD